MGLMLKPSKLAEEMSGAEFGDARLSRRLSGIVETMVRAPDRSFPSMFDDSALEGAYRFFNNEEVTPERILMPHVHATLGRMAVEPVTLVAHDTSTMSFDPYGVREGLGRVRSQGQAFFAHVSLALSGSGNRMPLGVLALSTRVRSAKKKRKVKAKNNADNERDRWGQQVTVVSSLGADRGRLVHVMDREADDFALLSQLVGHRDRFVVRLTYDRLLQPATADGAYKLAQAVAQTQCTAEREVALSRRPAAGRSPAQRKIHPPREGRMAKLAMGATSVTILRPATQPRTLPATLRLNVVRVWEIETPPGETPVEWVLVTTEPVDTAEQLLRVVDWYRARWVIEEFFKALKTGCAYGKRQLETLDGLLNVLATSIPIAWQMLRLRTQTRLSPKARATTMLSKPMLQVLLAFTRIKLPPSPTAREALLAIAALGGHLKHNGEPGWLTLARGYEKLLSLTAGWVAARGLAPCSDV